MSRRPFVLGAAIVAVLVLLYLAAGGLVAPRLLRETLVDWAAGRGIELGIETVRANPFAFAVALEGIEALGPGQRQLGGAAAIRADLAWSSLWRQTWIISKLSFDHPRVLIAIGEDRPVGPHREGRSSARHVLVERLAVRDGVVEFTQGTARSLRLEAITVDATRLSSRPGEAGEYQATARLAGGGTVGSRGHVTIEPLAAQGQVSASALALGAVAGFAWPPLDFLHGQLHGSAQFELAGGKLALQEADLSAVNPRDGAKAAAQGTMSFAPFAADLALQVEGIGPQYVRRWLPLGFRPTLSSGALSLDGRLRVDNGTTRYEGAAAVNGLRLDEADSDRPLLGWARLETGAAKLSFSPLALELGDVVARAPEGRLVIESDGSVNMLEAFAAGGKSAASPMRMSVRSLRIEEGVLHFADRSLETPFQVSIHDVAGTMTGFSTEPGDPALIELSGDVGKYGSARIHGSMNLANPTALADVRAELRNIDLARLTPYVAKFAGYRVRSGRVSADLHYSVRHGEIAGQNELLFRELVLGEKVEREGLKSLPLDLMVALLADSEGRIDLDIPVKGNLADPQFDLGGLVARAIGAAVMKIVSAPFRALASLFGAEQDSSPGDHEQRAAIRFAAGSAEVRPPGEEQLAKLAQALVERPGLGVVVHAAYDPKLDAAQLRLDSVRRAVLQRAGQPAEGPLDFRDPAIVRSAEALYRERVGDPGALRSMVENDVVYARALIERLAAEASLEVDAMLELARERGAAVREVFAAHGVDPERVATNTKQGGPTQLELTAASAIPNQAELVRAAQRSLKSAGFAAGPLDGILGPRTEAAVRAFQVDRGLQVSGTLDPATLAALGVQPSAAAGR